MIISVPDQTAVNELRAVGVFVPVEVGVQLSVDGLYRPPSLSPGPKAPDAPQAIISVPVHTAV
jgi:hypothetical protein